MDDLEKFAIEAAEEAGCSVLTPEEDEPDFRPLLAKAKEHADAGGGGAGLIRELLDMIDHLYGEIDAMQDHIRDHGPPCEADDEPEPLQPISSENIDAARTERGGWTRETLARWGVPWPPPRGWRKVLLGTSGARNEREVR